MKHKVLKKKQQQTIPKIDPGIQKTLGMLNVIKQLLHFILCKMVCYGALQKQYWPYIALIKSNNCILLHEYYT